jgi:DNA-binding FadR family transcriptional regulator
VVREAIKVLAAKGLVESRPKTGTRVRAPESWNLLDPDVLAWQQEGTPQPVFLRKLTEVRLIVEPAAAELAAQRGAGPELATLEASFARWRPPSRASPPTTTPSTRPTSCSTARSSRPATTTCSSR